MTESGLKKKKTTDIHSSNYETTDINDKILRENYMVKSCDHNYNINLIFIKYLLNIYLYLEY